MASSVIGYLNTSQQADNTPKAEGLDYRHPPSVNQKLQPVLERVQEKHPYACMKGVFYKH